MDWKKLLSSKRLGKTDADIVSFGRSPFQQDFDRIVFSSAFRRMQDKAQVFPLADNDHVRTRLTHSLECSCVGRSLGSKAGVFIKQNFDLGDIQPSDIGAVVAAAALAHDIGNPPLGHSGEESIRYWFANSPAAAEIRDWMSVKERADIERYEGNAQGFRVLSRLQMPDNEGGMQLTCATLAAFTKYPMESYVKNPPPGVTSKKFNFFQQDKELFAEVAENTGLKKLSDTEYCWARHPLAFLVEAADDICYNIVDFEDSFRMGIISYEELKKRFCAIIKNPKIEKQLKHLQNNNRRVEMLRAKTLGKLVEEVSEVFIRHHDAMLNGDLHESLVELIESADEMQDIVKRSYEDIYTYQAAAEIEAAGFELTEGLLEVFVSSANDVARSGYDNASYRSRKTMLLLPRKYWDENDEEWRRNHYMRVMNILDYISGMTDSYAVSLFKKIKGISLPGR